MADILPFEFEAARREAEPELVVDIDGFEGPLDLLLDLARRQKVDLREISILALAEQYLEFVETARGMRLELAADYLVMAAWLAYLKSRLLLPEPPKAEGPSAGDLALALAGRLRRLEAIRIVAQRLSERERLGRDVFFRGEDEAAGAPGRPVYVGELFELVSAYARQRQRQGHRQVTLERRRVWSLAEARHALERLIGRGGDWTALDVFLRDYLVDPSQHVTALASTFSAMLEMVREGRASLRQDAPFGPLLLKPCESRLRVVG